MRHLVGKTLGGYQLLDLLGAGGMGAVFLARQISLDREVALKILPDRFARNPEAMARFTREALSAAQLNHHNVVQVFDVGSDQGHHFISMEYVKGQSLADLIHSDGRLNVDDAAGYALQAARGLKYAHDNGIIHRDIKPDNLLLNEHGIVKIADMGLAKSIGDYEQSGKMPTEEELKNSDIEITLANRGLGTPAYMPPEQARDASSVDARADQYSLGCTLYYLCAGKAPYSGTTAFELITKHLKEPMTPLDVHIRNVPQAFEGLIERMLEKNPGDRYPNMGEVIKDIEGFLGVESDKGPYTPREQHANALDRSLEDFYGAPTAKIRQWSKLAFFSLCGVLAILSLLRGSFPVAGGFLGLMVLAPVFDFIINGIKTKAHLFRRVRSIFFGMPLKSWAITVIATVVALGVLFVLGWLVWWIVFAVVAFGIAMANQILVVRKLAVERANSITEMQKVLRELRLRGLSEEALQEFVCRFSKEHWEEFFDTLFGYEAMIHARNRWASIDQTMQRKRWATWRDPLSRWLDGIEQGRKDAREKRTLAKAETTRLRAQGISQKDAEKQANQEADNFAAEKKKKKTEAAIKAKAEKAVKAAAKVGKRSKVEILFALARAVVGLAIAGAGLIAWGVVPISVPGFAQGHLDTYNAMGKGDTFVGLIAGVILLVTVFFRGIICPLIVTVGVLLLVAYEKLVPMIDQPMLTEQVAFLGAAALTLGGFVLCLLTLKR